MLSLYSVLIIIEISLRIRKRLSKMDLQEFISVTPTRVEDLTYILNLESDSENKPYIVSWTDQEHREAITNPNIYHAILKNNETEKNIGFLILVGLRNKHQSLEFLRLVIEEKGKGYGQKALEWSQRFAFKTLGFHRLWLDVKTENQRALNLYKRMGFKEEGTLRDCLKTPSGYDSLIVLSLLKTEWPT